MQVVAVLIYKDSPQNGLFRNSGGQVSRRWRIHADNDRQVHHVAFDF